MERSGYALSLRNVTGSVGLKAHGHDASGAHGSCLNADMKKLLLALAFLAASPAAASDPARRAAAGEQHPGYGVVEMITPLRPEPSASAGASGTPRRSAARWLVKVRMDDGTIQVREIRKRTVAVGNRVLLTNAGDVLPD